MEQTYNQPWYFFLVEGEETRARPEEGKKEQPAMPPKTPNHVEVSLLLYFGPIFPLLQTWRKEKDIEWETQIPSPFIP